MPALYAGYVSFFSNNPDGGLGRELEQAIWLNFFLLILLAGVYTGDPQRLAVAGSLITALFDTDILGNG